MLCLVSSFRFLRNQLEISSIYEKIFKLQLINAFYQPLFYILTLLSSYLNLNCVTCHEKQDFLGVEMLC